MTFTLARFCTRPGVLLGLFWLALLAFGIPSVHGATPAVVDRRVATISRVVNRLVRDPERPRIYGTTTVDTVIAIDTQTLAIVGELPIGSKPVGLDLSPDGTRLYVVNSGSTAAGVGVVDLTTFTTLPSLPTPDFLNSLVAGLDGRLYVSGSLTYDANEVVYQISATDGAQQVTFGTDRLVYPSLLAISPDRKTLFTANFGNSPATLARYDVSTATPAFVEVNWNTLGENSKSIAVNHAGTALCFSTGTGQGTGQSKYGIALIPANNIQQALGIMKCGAYPDEGTFSPDDTRFYTTPSTVIEKVVKVYDTTTFLQVDSFPFGPSGSGWPLAVNDLVTDHGGGRLYVATEIDLRVFLAQAPPVPQITSAGTATAHQDESFDFQVTSNTAGGSFSALGLPAGLTMDSDGHISGTPTAAGRFNIALTVTDPNGSSGTGSLQLDVLTLFTVKIVGEGSVEPGGAGTTWRLPGSPFTLSATPAAGSAFVNWTGLHSSTSATISGTVAPKMTLTANFAPAATIEISVVGPGSVTPALAGTTTQVLGAQLSVTATPGLHARFIGWSGSIESDMPTLSFTVQPGLALVATFETIPFTELSVGVNGPGSVTAGLEGTTMRKVGENLMVTAMPAAGARFLGWTGSIISARRQLNFAVQPAMSLVANFESFAGYAGNYVLLAEPATSPKQAALIKITLNAGGSLTVGITHKGEHFGSNGSFGDRGAIDRVFNRTGGSSPLRLHLELARPDGKPMITGTLDFGIGPVEFGGRKLAAFTSLNPPPAAGKYTWGTPPSGESGAPGGCGFGTATVRKLGAVTFLGTLGDGTAVSAGSALETGGRAVLYIPLSTGGLLSGILNFREAPLNRDFDDKLRWWRPARPGARRFAEGFETVVWVIGSRASPVESNANLFTGMDGVVTFAGGDLTGSFNTLVSFLPDNRLKIPGPNPLNLRLEISPLDRVLSGSFLPPGASERVNVSGVMLSKAQVAVGRFRGSSDFGSVFVLGPGSIAVW